MVFSNKNRVSQGGVDMTENMKALNLEELDGVVGGVKLSSDEAKLNDFDEVWEQMGLDDNPNITSHQKDAAKDEFLMQKKNAKTFLKNWKN